MHAWGCQGPQLPVNVDYRHDLRLSVDKEGREGKVG